MSMPELGLGEISYILNIFLILIVIVIFAMMGKEAKHFFGLKGKGDIFSLITMPPGGGGLTLKKIKWTGEYFEYKKEAIYFNFDFLEDPQKDPEKRFNELLKQVSFWAYSKVPVLMGYEASCFVFNPGIPMHVEAAREMPPTEGEEQTETDNEYEENTKAILEHLGKTLKPKINRVTIIKPFTISAIREYLGRSSSPQKMKNLLDKGRSIGRFEMTKPKEPLNLPKWALPLGTILLILILAGSGAFGDLGGLFKPK